MKESESMDISGTRTPEQSGDITSRSTDEVDPFGEFNSGNSIGECGQG